MFSAITLTEIRSACAESSENSPHRLQIMNKVNHNPLRAVLVTGAGYGWAPTAYGPADCSAEEYIHWGSHPDAQ